MIRYVSGEIKFLVEIGYNYEPGKEQQEREEIIEGMKKFISQSPMLVSTKLIEDDNLTDI